MCRLAGAALVGKQFWRACLLLPLDVSIRPPGHLFPPQHHAWLQSRLLALQGFLSRHAPAVRSLEFHSDSQATAGQEEVAVLADCLALCSAGGSPLARLDVNTGVEVQRLAGYLPSLHGLRHLKL